MPEIIQRLAARNQTYVVGSPWPPGNDKDWVVAAIFHRPGTEERFDSDSAGGLLELVQSVKKGLNGSAVAELEEIESALGELSELESTKEHYEIWKTPNSFFAVFFAPLLQALFYDRLANASSFFNQSAINSVMEDLEKNKVVTFTCRVVYSPSVVDWEWPVNEVILEMGERFQELGEEAERSESAKPEPATSPAPT